MNFYIEKNYLLTGFQEHRTLYTIVCLAVLALALRWCYSSTVRDNVRLVTRAFFKFVRDNRFKVVIMTGMIVFLFQVHAVVLSLEGINNNLNNWDAAISE